MWRKQNCKLWNCFFTRFNNCTTHKSTHKVAERPWIKYVVGCGEWNACSEKNNIKATLKGRFLSRPYKISQITSRPQPNWWLKCRSLSASRGSPPRLNEREKHLVNNLPKEHFYCRATALPITTNPFPINPAKKMKLNEIKTDMETRCCNSSMGLVVSFSKNKGSFVTLCINVKFK